MGRGLCSGHYAQVYTRGEAARPLSIRHGLGRDPLYSVWCNIKQRTLNPSCAEYASYGGRGIGLHAPWRTFTTLYADIMGSIGARPGPSRAWQLDRIDNDGSYEPGNVRWATAAQNSNNKRSMRSMQAELDTLRSENAALRARLGD